MISIYVKTFNSLKQSLTATRPTSNY